MKAVVLAAGEGRRLRPLTGDRGKGMLPVANRPIISYVIENLATCGIRDLVVVVGYQKEKVMNLLGNGKELGLRIEYVEQKFQLGTAHALHQARDSICGGREGTPNKVSERFLVVPGDSIVNQKALSRLVSIPEGEWGMLAASSANSSKYGVVTAREEHLAAIHEKHKITEDLVSSGTPSIVALALWDQRTPSDSSLINTGTYLLDEGIFRLLGTKDLGEPLRLTTCISEEAVRRPVKVITIDSWLDAVYPWDLLTINEHILTSTPRESAGTMEEGVVIKGSVRIGEGARVRCNTVIEGPAVIGPGTSIGPSAYVGPNTSIGENCAIGPFTAVKGSIIMDDTVLGTHSSVNRSIIGNGCRIGDMFCIEQGENTILLEKRFTTKKLGAIVGSDCVISDHVSMGQGVLLGNGCKVGPHRHVRDNLQDGTNAV
ncbi:MAG: sugar phosphate nucleotidyltransferase [Candidatus Thermoplasmatota archaeon]|nr:sugar phosphate nucleotidyltransferase [Candidatus Thermoplasmatota archaeon]